MCFNSQAMSLGIQQKPKLREISLVPNNLILFLGIQSMPNTREHISLLYLDIIMTGEDKKVIVCKHILQNTGQVQLKFWILYCMHRHLGTR